MHSPTPRQSARAIPFRISKSVGDALLVQSDEGDYFYPHLHHHPEYQLTAIVKGEGLFYAGNHISAFNEGVVFLTGSHIPHLFKHNAVYYSPNSPGVKGISLFFDYNSFGRHFFDIGEMARIKALLHSCQRVVKVLPCGQKGLFEAICQLPSLEGSARVIGFLQVLDMLADAEKEYLHAVPYRLAMNESSGGRLNDVLHFSFQNYQQNISIAQVAEVACLSRSQFSHFFKVHTGKTYVQFLNELRIEHACNMLRQAQYSIHQIAFEAGFQNIANFIRQFKKARQCTPSAYRKAWRN